MTSIRPTAAIDSARSSTWKRRRPSTAWLPRCEPTTLRLTAFFEPRGLFGYLYWYVVLPFHEFVFGNMVRRIGEEAEMLAVSQATSDAA